MVSPRHLVEAARQAGLAVVAVTDHDTMAGVPEAVAAGQELGVEVVAGEEITTGGLGKVHVLGLFLAGPVRMGMSVEDTIRAVHDQGGLAVLAHPFMPTFFASITPTSLRRLLRRTPVDGVELCHTALTTPMRSRQLDQFYDLHRDRMGAAIGSSDSHFGALDLARNVTVYPGSGAADLRRAMEGARTRPLARYLVPAGPSLPDRLRQQGRSMGWLTWQRLTGRVGREGALPA